MTTLEAQLAVALRGAGVTRAFTVPSVHNLHLIDALAAAGIELTGCRTELGTVHAADGHARRSGDRTVAMTSTGPGAGNAVGPFCSATKDGSPVIHLTTWDGSTAMSPLHRVPEQRQWAESMGSAVIELVEEHTIEDLERLLAGPAQPFTILAPTASSTQASAPGAATGTSASSETMPTVDDNTIGHALAPWLASSSRLLWIGGGARASIDQALRLADIAGAAVVTTGQAKDLVDTTCPTFVGCTLNAPITGEAIAGATVCLALGSRMTAFSTGSWDRSLPRLIVDANVAGSVRAVPDGDAHMAGDVASTIEVAIRALGDSPSQAFGIESRKRAGALVASAARREEMGWVDAIGSTLRAGDVVVADTTKLSFWSVVGLDVPRGARFLFSGQLSMGFGLPAAIGAATATNRGHVIAIVGDGALLSTLPELDTLAGLEAAVTVLLVDDDGYGILRRPGRAASALCEIAGPDWSALVTSFGLDFVELGRPSAERLKAVLGARPSRPRVVRVDGSWIGRDWRSGYLTAMGA